MDIHKRSTVPPTQFGCFNDRVIFSKCWLDDSKWMNYELLLKHTTFTDYIITCMLGLFNSCIRIRVQQCALHNILIIVCGNIWLHNGKSIQDIPGKCICQNAARFFKYWQQLLLDAHSTFLGSAATFVFVICNQLR